MQDEIIARVVRTLDEKLIAVEARRARRSGAENPEHSTTTFPVGRLSTAALTTPT
jgi:hypothetical protein